MWQHPGSADGRKRARGAPPRACEKRRRSGLMHCRNGAGWARAAEALRREPDSDSDMDEAVAVAALLAIGEEPWQPEVKLEVRELSAHSLGALPDCSAAALAAKAAGADERWPCASSSGSDASTTAALPPPRDAGSCRSSFDSARPAGAQQARLPRWESCQLPGADATEGSLPLSSQPSPALTPQKVSITTKLGAAPATMHASFWDASLWQPRARLAGAAAACNVVSSGVPAPPAAKLPGLQVGAAAVDALSSQPWARPLQPLSQPGKAAVPGPLLDARGPAPCNSSRLVVVTQSPAAASEPPSLPSRTIVVQSLQLHSQRSWPPSQAGAAPGRLPAVPTRVNSADEAGERRWQANWNLDLYSALNPAVVTTGHSTCKRVGAEAK